MTFFRHFLATILFATTASVGMAAATTNAAPAVSAKKEAGDKTQTAAPAPAAAAPAPAPAAAPKAAGLTLNDYLNELNDDLKLSDEEKTEIQADYVNDGPALQKILNDDLLSPLQKKAQVDQLRETRNAKIEPLLGTMELRADFEKVEAKYRAALIDLAADGQFVAAPPAPAPAPAPAAKS